MAVGRACSQGSFGNLLDRSSWSERPGSCAVEVSAEIPRAARAIARSPCSELSRAFPLDSCLFLSFTLAASFHVPLLNEFTCFLVRHAM